MRISVLIIAHNEGAHIAGCIESLLNQTRPPDEIVLISHNSTDDTEEIARRFPITVIPVKGPPGAPHARIAGLRAVTGDMILCIDGDSAAAPDWVEILSRTLEGNVLAGTRVKFEGNAYGYLINHFTKGNFEQTGPRAAEWIWGPSLALWSRDKEKVIDILERSESLSKQLGLSRNPDDYWMALLMSKRGPVRVTNRTQVTCVVKEIGWLSAVLRNIENVRNGMKMRRYAESL